MATISAEIDEKLINLLNTQIEERAQIKKRAIESAINLWVSLPSECQSKILVEEFNSEDLFSDLIGYVIDRRVGAYCELVLKKLEELEEKESKRIHAIEQLGKRSNRFAKKNVTAKKVLPAGS